MFIFGDDNDAEFDAGSPNGETVIFGNDNDVDVHRSANNTVHVTGNSNNIDSGFVPGSDNTTIAVNGDNNVVDINDSPDSEVDIEGDGNEVDITDSSDTTVGNVNLVDIMYQIGCTIEVNDDGQTLGNVDCN